MNGHTPEKVSIDISIDEFWELIAYHHKIADYIPKESYHVKNMAGTTMETTVRKHRARAHELDVLLNKTWPK